MKKGRGEQSNPVSIRLVQSGCQHSNPIIILSRLHLVYNGFGISRRQMIVCSPRPKRNEESMMAGLRKYLHGWHH